MHLVRRYQVFFYYTVNVSAIVSGDVINEPRVLHVVSKSVILDCVYCRRVVFSLNNLRFNPVKVLTRLVGTYISTVSSSKLSSGVIVTLNPNDDELTKANTVSPGIVNNVTGSSRTSGNVGCGKIFTCMSVDCVNNNVVSPVYGTLEI